MSEIDVSKCSYRYKDSCNLYEGNCSNYMDCDYRQLQQVNKKLDKIKDLCCENIKKCDKPCFMCSNTCIEEKIVTIINTKLDIYKR